MDGGCLTCQSSYIALGLKLYHLNTVLLPRFQVPKQRGFRPVTKQIIQFPYKHIWNIEAILDRFAETLQLSIAQKGSWSQLVAHLSSYTLKVLYELLCISWHFNIAFGRDVKVARQSGAIPGAWPLQAYVPFWSSGAKRLKWNCCGWGVVLLFLFVVGSRLLYSKS